MSNLDNTLFRSPQNLQQDVVGGLHKGIVVKVNDPHQLGRVGVHIYGTNADFPDLDVKNLVWCELLVPLRGAFTPPEMWDRVWVQYDAGDRNSPVVVGFWNAVSTGRGTLPPTRVKGSSIRPENWHHHDLYPETKMIACSGNGNAVWIEDKYVSNNFLSSSINLEDTGGKFIEIKSFHTEVAAYASDSDLPADLYQADIPPCEPVRDGITPVKEPSAGSIRFGHQNLQRELLTSSDGTTIDSVNQMQPNGDQGLNEVLIAGRVKRTSIGASSITHTPNGIFFMGPLFAMNMQTLPRRWD